METHRPSLALTGFVDLFTFDRPQILGNTELLYLNNMGSEGRRRALEIIYQFDLPCVILTNGFDGWSEQVELAEKMSIPLLRTSLSTARFIHQFVTILDEFFAPRTALHGTMVDVYGVGLLLSGLSGIGKSEIALDLVERGHRLVADDVVHVFRQKSILQSEASPVLGHKMEIRGIGIIDVEKLFGIRAIRKVKRLEVILNLVRWDNREQYERVGLEDDSKCILGVAVPMVHLPIFPGKNITVIAETIAMNYLLRLQGYSAARDLDVALTSALCKPHPSPSVPDAPESDLDGR